jgi:hypothetical protein
VQTFTVCKALLWQGAELIPCELQGGDVGSCIEDSDALMEQGCFSYYDERC